MTTWHPHHIAERYGLFTIIVLGECVLAATWPCRWWSRSTGWDLDLLLVGGGGLVCCSPCGGCTSSRRPRTGWPGTGSCRSCGATATTRSSRSLAALGAASRSPSSAVGPPRRGVRPAGRAGRRRAGRALPGHRLAAARAARRRATGPAWSRWRLAIVATLAVAAPGAARAAAALAGRPGRRAPAVLVAIHRDPHRSLGSSSGASWRTARAPARPPPAAGGRSSTAPPCRAGHRSADVADEDRRRAARGDGAEGARRRVGVRPRPPRAGCGHRAAAPRAGPPGGCPVVVLADQDVDPDHGYSPSPEQPGP